MPEYELPIVLATARAVVAFELITPRSCQTATSATITTIKIRITGTSAERLLFFFFFFFLVLMLKYIRPFLRVFVG